MDFNQLITYLQELDSTLKLAAGKTTSMALICRNWFAGASIVEFEQQGEKRAEYGKKLISTLAKELSINGLNARNLEASRQLYLHYPQLISQTSAKSALPFLSIPQTSAKLTELLSRTQVKQQQTLEIRPSFAPSEQHLLTSLTFSHFVELLRVKDSTARAFYEIEAIKAAWSVRALKRQIGSLLFERLGLSTDKEKLLRLTADELVYPQIPADFIKDPYIFEFLGLQPKEVFRENDLETALLDHLQEFLLELGSGFCFEDRQKKIRIGQSDYFVDLVFYHRRLHCHVLIELKAEPFNHVNASQLNTYVNYYKKNERQEGDNPPIGLLLCTDKDHALVEYALGGMDENLFVSAYQIALPSPEELQSFLEQHY